MAKKYANYGNRYYSKAKKFKSMAKSMPKSEPQSMPLGIGTLDTELQGVLRRQSKLWRKKVMNRKQKRKLLANKYPEVYDAKQRYTRDQVEAVTTMEVNRVMGNLLASVLLTLRDEHGFGNQRLAKFMDDTFSQMDAITKEYVTAQDILETIEDETGLNYYDYANEIAKKVKV